MREYIHKVIVPLITRSVLRVVAPDIAFGIDTVVTALTHAFAKDVPLSESRRVERLLTEMVDEIAESMEPIFLAHRVSEHRAMAIMDAAEATIADYEFSAESLLKAKLSAAQIYQALLKENPNGGEKLEEGEVHIYQTLLHGCSEAIVRLAEAFPGFTAIAVRTILENQEIIKENLKEFAAELARRLPMSGGNDNSNFEMEYRAAISENLDRVELFGIEQDSLYSRYQLSIAYVDLRLNSEETISLSDFGRIPGFGTFQVKSYYETRRHIALPDEPIHIEPEISRFDSKYFERRDSLPDTKTALLMSKSRRLIVRGAAGSGKTTLLRWFAVRAARREHDAFLREANDEVCFLVPLRQCVKDGFPTAEELPRFAAPELRARVPGDWVRRKMKDGQAAVLIDGVDELPDTMRPAFQEWLRTMCRDYPDARYLISTRPHGLPEEGLPEFEFADAELQKLGTDEIKRFVHYWHKAISAKIADEHAKTKFMEFEGQILNAFDGNKALRLLAETPLLCAVLCALNLRAQGDLPDDRIQVYQDCIRMMLERREQWKPNPPAALGDYPKMNLRQQLHLVQHLAYSMLTRDWSELTQDEVDAYMAEGAARIFKPEQLDEYNGEILRRFFLERCGILREPAADMIDFPHRTFQEYLAAEVLAEKREFRLLAERSHDDAWRETIGLVAEILPTSAEVQDFADKIIAQADKSAERDIRSKRILIAAMVADRAMESANVNRNEINARLKNILPPQSLSEANALGPVGDLAVPYLKYKKTRTAREARACARALGRIGGESAKMAIREYSQEKRKSVYFEALASAVELDTLESFRGTWVLKGVYEKLDISKYGTLSFISPDSMTEDLRITGNLNGELDISDLAPINNMLSLNLEGDLNLLRLNRLKQVITLRIDEVRSFDSIPPNTRALFCKGSGLTDAQIKNLPSSLDTLWILNGNQLRADSRWAKKFDHLSIQNLGLLDQKDSRTSNESSRTKLPSNLDLRLFKGLRSLWLFNLREIHALQLPDEINSLKIEMLMLDPEMHARTEAMLGSLAGLRQLRELTLPLVPLGKAASLERLPALEKLYLHKADIEELPVILARTKSLRTMEVFRAYETWPGHVELGFLPAKPPHPEFSLRLSGYVTQPTVENPHTQWRYEYQVDPTNNLSSILVCAKMSE